jgi:hypothetical protein
MGKNLYYRLEEKIFPLNTKRRMFAHTVFRVLRGTLAVFRVYYYLITDHRTDFKSPPIHKSKQCLGPVRGDMSLRLLDVRLLTCISFLYVESRLHYLQEVLSQQPYLAGRTDVRIFTNTAEHHDLANIQQCFPKAQVRSSFSVVSICGLPHPYFLPWAHKQVLAKDFVGGRDYTHFMYIEDDLLVRPENITYWLSARQTLRHYGLIPSFFRVEKKTGDNVWRSTDLLKKLTLSETPMLRVSGGRWYINLNNPFQAMYLFDRELALEHLAGPAMNPDFGVWGIREKAAQGQTFVVVPEGFTARNVVPFDPDQLIVDPCCWVHHLPNSYANDPSSMHGKLAVDDLVSYPWLWRLLARIASRPILPIKKGEIPFVDKGIH